MKLRDVNICSNKYGFYWIASSAIRLVAMTRRSQTPSRNRIATLAVAWFGRAHLLRSCEEVTAHREMETKNYLVRNENFPIFSSALLVPRATERRGSSATMNGILQLLLNRCANPRINAPPPAMYTPFR